MNIKCVDCEGTGRKGNSRCSSCNGYRTCEIEPTEFLRQNKMRLSRNLPKLERVKNSQRK